MHDVTVTDPVLKPGAHGHDAACWHMRYTEKATPARHRPERQYNACANRRKQCSPNETKPYSNPTPPRKRQNNPTNGRTPRRMKPTHARLTYPRMRLHAPSHQAGDQPVPAHTERHNPSKVRTQRQPGLPPRRVCADSYFHAVASPLHSFVTAGSAWRRADPRATLEYVYPPPRPCTCTCAQTYVLIVGFAVVSFTILPF